MYFQFRNVIKEVEIDYNNYMKKIEAAVKNENNFFHYERLQYVKNGVYVSENIPTNKKEKKN